MHTITAEEGVEGVGTLCQRVPSPPQQPDCWTMPLSRASATRPEMARVVALYARDDASVDALVSSGECFHIAPGTSSARVRCVQASALPSAKMCLSRDHACQWMDVTTRDATRRFALPMPPRGAKHKAGHDHPQQNGDGGGGCGGIDDNGGGGCGGIDDNGVGGCDGIDDKGVGGCDGIDYARPLLLPVRDASGRWWWSDGEAGVHGAIYHLAVLPVTHRQRQYGTLGPLVGNRPSNARPVGLLHCDATDVLLHSFDNGSVYVWDVAADASCLGRKPRFVCKHRCPGHARGLEYVQATTGGGVAWAVAAVAATTRTTGCTVTVYACDLDARRRQRRQCAGEAARLEAFTWSDSGADAPQHEPRQAPAPALVHALGFASCGRYVVAAVSTEQSALRSEVVVLSWDRSSPSPTAKRAPASRVIARAWPRALDLSRASALLVDVPHPAAVRVWVACTLPVRRRSDQGEESGTDMCLHVAAHAVAFE